MPSFQYIPVSKELKDQMQVYRDKYQELSTELEKLPKSEGLTQALRKLRESSFWLNAGLTGNS